MIIADFAQVAQRYWREVLEILVLWLVIYQLWLHFRGTRGAKVLSGLALLTLGVLLFSQFFQLPVIDWLFRNLTTVLLFSLVVIFQPALENRFFVESSRLPFGKPSMRSGVRADTRQTSQGRFRLQENSPDGACHCTFAAILF